MPPPNLPVDQGYAPFPATLPPYIGAVMFESFLYGLYVVLFIICIYVLLQRQKTLHWVLLASAIVMFGLATADIVYTYYLVFDKLLVGGIGFNDLRPKYWLYVTNNVIADSLLLYRCYVVWGFKKRVIAGPVALLIAGTVCGYVFEGGPPQRFKYTWIYLSMTFVLNLVLTSLTAGRIWWLARKARLILGPGLLQRYNATINILIESGFIYLTYIALDLALQKNKVGNAILDAGLIQAVGIMPTLIIVQVGLGRAVHDMEANDAIARLEANKIVNRSNADTLHYIRSRECNYASNETFVSCDTP
ncbi:hypothetical protein B0H34DRAFT_529383 [Crassisporium funariophilum]|nr:hypothetical protein B0H34DRAFT_529383 [Crassisporium funariophilum]